MKKLITLVLTLALLLTSVAVIADTNPIPNINTFAKMRVSCNDRGYSFRFDRPVDRLLVNWTDGTGLQELLIDENLRAYAFRGNHKYLAGIEEHYSSSKSVIEKYRGETLSEHIELDPVTGLEIVRETRTYVRIQALKYNNKMEENIAKFRERYKNYEIEIIEPQLLIEGHIDENGEFVKSPVVDENGNYVYTDGEMRAYSVKTKYYKTNIATPDQIAFITLQDDEWVVYYNRSGMIVGVEHYENQF
ncbi:MAG: hypothetical protein IKH30_17545 [Clostridia bacterium]|nr:hypothetical protein [Clostridia bacterium]